MPDHLHWLITLGEVADLATVVRRAKGRSTIALNRSHRAPGRRIWQRGFHDRAICADQDLRCAARYVVANPLRAGLVDDLGAYPLWDAAWL